MNGFRRTFRAVAVLAAVLMAGLAFGAATGPAGKSPQTFWIDLAGQAERKPGFVYFTANAGGTVKNLKWKKWGRSKAIGRGYFQDNSASFPGKLDQDGPAKIVVWKLRRCRPDFGNKEGRTVHVYRRAKLRYSDGKGGRKVVGISGHGASGCL